MKIRRNGSKGFTTLEMIVTVLVATMILGAITGFMTTMTKSYKVTQDIVDLQYQAQVTMNKIVDEIMYANEVKKIYDGGKGIHLLKIYKEDHNEQIKEKHIYIRQDENNILYYREENNELGLGASEQEKEETLKDKLFQKQYQLATNVVDISFKTDIDLNVSNSRYIDVSMTFENSKEIKISNRVWMRNR